MLLERWASTWAIAANAHTLAGRKKRFCHHIIAVPMTLIPLVLTAFTTNNILEENHIFVVIGLIVVACLNSFQTVMRFDSVAAKHDAAAWRYQDLLSDVEEVLSKRTADRPDPDLFVASMKVRSDFNTRFAPDVVIPEGESDDDDDLVEFTVSDTDKGSRIQAKGYNLMEERKQRKATR